MSVNSPHEIVQLENANSLKLKKENKRTKTLKLVQIGKLCVFVVFIFVFFGGNLLKMDDRFPTCRMQICPTPSTIITCIFFRYYTTENSFC